MEVDGGMCSLLCVLPSYCTQFVIELQEGDCEGTDEEKKQGSNEVHITEFILISLLSPWK